MYMHTLPSHRFSSAASLSICQSFTLHHSPVSSLYHYPLICFPFSLDCSFILVHYENPGPREIRRPLPVGTVRLCYNEFNVNSSQVPKVVKMSRRVQRDVFGRNVSIIRPKGAVNEC